jgi:ribosomal protein S18 acetylase RimI-like enzyme
MNEEGQQTKIRPAVAADVTAITALVDRAYGIYLERIGGPPGPMHHDYAEKVSQCDAFVYDDQGVAGLLVLIHEPGHLTIENVAVDPARQGEGIGRALLDFAENRAREVGRLELRLFTHVKMAENQAIYRARGYRELERQQGPGFELVFFGKELGPERP